MNTENDKLDNSKVDDKKVNNKHDKTYRTILSKKENAAYIINRALNLENEQKVKAEELEKYISSFITEGLKNKEADIVYKLKNEDIYFLIEHQSKIDYSMPYRIIEYQREITKSAIDGKKVKTKDYDIPTVIPIVLYTGRKKWNAKLYLNKINNDRFKDINLLKYNLIDINEYTEKDLLQSKNFIEQIFLLEKCKDLEELMKKAKIIRKQITDKEDIKLLDKIMDLTLDKKNRGDGNYMMTVERLRIKEHRMIRKEGRKEGWVQGRIDMIMTMLKNSMKIEDIEKFAGATKEEIEKIKAMDKKDIHKS